MLKAIALTLLTAGIIASSLALAPIARMVRLFQSELNAIGATVTKEAKDKAPASLRSSTEFLWVDTSRWSQMVRADLTRVEALLKKAKKTSLMGQVKRTITPLDEADKLRAEKKAKKAAAQQSRARAEFANLHRQLVENLGKAYAAVKKDFKVLGKDVGDRRAALGRDLDRVDKAIPGLVAVANARKTLAKWDEAYKKREARLADRWKNPIWWLFAVGIVAMVIGIFINRRIDHQRAVAEAERTRTSGGDIAGYVDGIVNGVRALVGSLDTISDDQLRKELDRIISGPVFDLVESRLVLEHVLGLKPYAMAMSTLASAERFLNRAWSALTDGYPDEARDSVSGAMTRLEEFEKQVAGAIGRAPKPSESPPNA